MLQHEEKSMFSGVGGGAGGTKVDAIIAHRAGKKRIGGERRISEYIKRGGGDISLQMTRESQHSFGFFPAHRTHCTRAVYIYTIQGLAAKS